MNSQSEKKIELLMNLRAKMWLKKIRQKDIATKIGRNQSLISHVLSGRKTSAPVIRAIREAVNGGRKFVQREKV